MKRRALLLVLAGSWLLSIPASAQFLPASYYSLGSLNGEPQSIATADFDNDGRLDLAIGDTFHEAVNILLNRGDGTFVRTAALPYPAISLAAVDVNGDGNIDLVALSYSGAQLEIFLGNGTGAFHRAGISRTGPRPYTVTVADFDGDGKIDFAVANSNDGRTAPGSVSVLFGDGNGGMRTKTEYALATGRPWGIVAGDFNRDGHPDLAVTKNNDAQPRPDLSILLNNGDGSFQPEVRYTVGQFEDLFVVAADLNHDGNLDLVLADNGMGIDVVLGNGDGTFGNATFYPTLNRLAYGEVVEDFNQDGNLDVAVASCSCLFYGNGDGSLQSAIAIDVREGGYSLAAGDFDRDGAPDLALTVFFANKAAVLLNTQ